MNTREIIKLLQGVIETLEKRVTMEDAEQRRHESFKDLAKDPEAEFDREIDQQQYDRLEGFRPLKNYPTAREVVAIAGVTHGQAMLMLEHFTVLKRS